VFRIPFHVASAILLSTLDLDIKIFGDIPLDYYTVLSVASNGGVNCKGFGRRRPWPNQESSNRSWRY
jgi:hypothetical protein